MAKTTAVDIKARAKPTPDVTNKDTREKVVPQVLHLSLTPAEHREFKVEALNAEITMLEHFRAVWKFWQEAQKK
jgi:hypothetical protein